MFSLARPSEVPSDLICAICMMVPLQPVTLEACEHIFCRDCVGESLKRQPSCPIDRLACQDHQVHPLRPNSFAHRIWSSVVVQCERCVWTGSVADFSEHQTKCEGQTILSSQKEREYLARIDHLTWEVSFLSNNQRELESNNQQLIYRNQELQEALQAKNHALRTTVDVLATAISNSKIDSATAENVLYDRSSILQLVQQMCQNLETRPVDTDCSANELFEFVEMIYLDLKTGGKHANNDYFRDDVKLILGVVGASSWFSGPQRAIIQSWCQEQGWGSY